MQGVKEYEFSDKDFDGMSFPVHRLNKRANVLVEYPVLQKYPEFKLIMPLSLHKIFRYTVYMYDWRSPLRVQIEDFKVRKYNAMLLAGYGLNEMGEFDVPVNEVLMNENSDVLRIAFRYARMTMGEKYMTLVALQNGHQKALHNVSKGDSKSYAELERLRKHMEEILSDLLSQDNIGSIENKFLDYVEMETLGIRPEDIAFALNEGKPVLMGVNPYDLKSRKHGLTIDKELYMKKLQDKYGSFTAEH